MSAEATRSRVSWRLSAPSAGTIVEAYRLVPSGRFLRRHRVLRAQTSAGQLHVRLRRGRYEVVLTALSAAGHPTDVAHLFVQ